MKILIFNWKDIKHPYAGGAEINIHEQAKRWVKQGHKVTQFSPLYHNAKEIELIGGVKIIRKGERFSNYIWAFIYYLKNLRKEADVIIDIENGIPYFTPLYSRKPIVCLMHHVHQKVFFEELPAVIAWIPYLLERYGIRTVYHNKKFIAVSQTTKEEMEKTLKIKPENIEIVYNGINHEEFKSNAKKTKYPSLIYFGRLMKYKRIGTLIDIFNDVIKIMPEAKLHIAGTGIIEEELKNKTKQMKLDNKIIFHGLVSNKERKDLIKSSWVFVNPSSVEGWGVTVIESNAVSVPAIVFNVPGLKEAVKNKETGIITETEKEMTQQIIKLLKDENLRNKLGKNAQNWSKNFSWDKTAEKTLKILKGLK